MADEYLARKNFVAQAKAKENNIVQMQNKCSDDKKNTKLNSNQAENSSIFERIKSENNNTNPLLIEQHSELGTDLFLSKDVIFMFDRAMFDINGNDNFTLVLFNIRI